MKIVKVRAFLYLVALLVFLSLFISCTTTLYIMPEYKGRIIEAKKLAVIYSDIYIDNTKAVLDDLGKGDPQEVYTDFFEFNFMKSLIENSNFAAIEYVYNYQKENFKTYTYDIGKKDVLVINLPQEGKPVITNTLKADFVLFIQNIYTSRIPATKGVWIAGTNGTSAYAGGSSSELQQKFEYVIWDNSMGKMVAYGKATSQVSFLFQMTDNTWKKGLNNIVKIILKNTPFGDFS